MTPDVAVSAPDPMSYFWAVASHPACTARFQLDLVQPGLRLLTTADASLFAEAVDIGREVIRLHCFGERFADPSAKRSNGTPCLLAGERPVIPRDGAIAIDPDRIDCDVAVRRLRIGELRVGLMAPLALDVAFQVQDELVARAEEADLWRAQRVQRAREEADRARQRFLQTHPDNRMVADVMEAEWNAKFRAPEEAQREFELSRAEPGQGWTISNASGPSGWPATSRACGTIRRRRTAIASGWRGCRSRT